MSYGTDFTADIFLNRQVYENKAQVESVIEDCEQTINVLERQLYLMAVSNVREITPKDEEPLLWITANVDGILSELSDEVIKRYQLGLYLEFLEK